MVGMIGKKLGMTQVFNEDGTQVPVTVVQVGPCVVVQRKTKETDGYDAVQLGFEEQKPQRMTKALLGHFKKVDAAPQKVLCEFLVEPEDELKGGETLTAELFSDVNYVDVTGVTKGRGFQGVIRKYRMKGQPASHGSKSTRRVGSIGQCEFPGRVFRGRRMPGQMGNANRTVQNLKINNVRVEDGVLLIKGAIPGPTGSVVVVRKSIKKA